MAGSNRYRVTLVAAGLVAAVVPWSFDRLHGLAFERGIESALHRVEGLSAGATEVDAGAITLRCASA